MSAAGESVRLSSYRLRVRVGVVGHRWLSAEAAGFVGTACARLMTGIGRDSGQATAVSALAEGADTVFAAMAVASGFALEVVQPHGDYVADFTTTCVRARYEALCALAQRRTTMPFRHRSDLAYQAAMRRVADRSDLLAAIWDGRPSAYIGGTAETVRYARANGRLIAQLHPQAGIISVG